MRKAAHKRIRGLAAGSAVGLAAISSAQTPSTEPATQPTIPTHSPEGRRYRNPPLVTSVYTADPSAHVFDGRIYVYVSHDIDGPSLPDVEPFKGSQGNAFKMRDYLVLSMDRVGGEVTVHPPLLDIKDVPWAARQMWAPDVAFKGGTYYLYFPAKAHDGAFRIGVATSQHPAGPFSARPEPIQGSYSIDPAVFIDDDGQSYLYFGGLSGGQLQMIVDGQYEPDAPKSEQANADQPLMPRVARLTEDMLEFAEKPRDAMIVDRDGKPIGDGDRKFFEAAWVHKRDGKYYLSYSTGGTHFIAYAIGDSPYGPFVHQGNILLPVQGWTTHHSVVQIQGSWWLFYADSQMSDKTWFRNVKVAELTYNADGTIQTIDPFVKD